VLPHVPEHLKDKSVEEVTAMRNTALKNLRKATRELRENGPSPDARLVEVKNIGSLLEGLYALEKTTEGTEQQSVTALINNLHASLDAARQMS
jgi:hypothetical protein